MAGAKLQSRIATNEHSDDAVIRSTVADWLNELGLHLIFLGRVKESLKCFERCLALCRELGEREGEVAALGNLGSAYYSLGEARKAIEFFDEALVIAREIGDRRGEGTALWNCALALNRIGDQAQAIARAEAAMNVYKTIEDPNAAQVRAALADWRAAKL